MAIWITSDWHLNHDKDFIYGPRGFNNVYEMNEAIITLHNECVAPDDDVYVLGDCTLGDINVGHDLIAQMKGRLHIAIGNHSTDNRIEMYNHLWNVVEIEYAYRIKYGKWRFYATHYPSLTANYTDGKAPAQHTICLCGHSHTQDRFADWDKGMIYHCEMDAHHCCPVNIEDIISDIRMKCGKT